jgi:hypothetical protein
MKRASQKSNWLPSYGRGTFLSCVAKFSKHNVGAGVDILVYESLPFFPASFYSPNLFDIRGPGSVRQPKSTKLPLRDILN